MFYFTSDEHHLDDSINHYCKTVFETKEDRMRTIIRLHNDTVTEEDEVYHLGDFTLEIDDPDILREIVSKYKKVKKRILISGNHDLPGGLAFISDFFDEIHTWKIIEYDGFEFFLMHDPAFYQPKMWDKIGVCGHVHSLFLGIPERKIYNVGVDVNNYRPVSINRVLAYLMVQGEIRRQ
jgi:calcineurin-like phosphoesterase family protein